MYLCNISIYLPTYISIHQSIYHARMHTRTMHAFDISIIIMIIILIIILTSIIIIIIIIIMPEIACPRLHIMDCIA